jgi:transposase
MNAEHYRSEMTLSGVSDMGEDIGFCFAALRVRLLDLIATVIDFCTPPKERGRGHPRSATVRVVATLRQFLREGTPWRSLQATTGKVSGSSLRRHLEEWARLGLLAQVHAVLVGMLRGNPSLILDSCSARAKRGGDLTGPNPTDRAKAGSKYHVAVTGDGVPLSRILRMRCRARGGLRGHGRQCQRHLGVRAAVSGRLRRHGPDPDRVRRQGL